MRRRRAALVLLGLLLLGAGCGREGPPVGRVLLTTFALDEAPRPPLSLVSLDPARAASVPLVPDPASGPSVFLAPGAPSGAFEIRSPDGAWVTMHTGPVPPVLTPGGPPVLVRIAHPYTIYLAPGDPNLHPGRTWVVRRRPATADGAWERVDAEVVLEPRGREAGLRVARSDWHGVLEIWGLLAPRPASAADGEPESLARGARVAEPLSFQAEESGHPYYGQLLPAPEEPVLVGLVPSTRETETDGREVTIGLRGLPLALSLTQPSREGVARFPRLPSLERPLAVTVEGNLEVEVPPDARRRGTLYVLVLPPSGGRRVVVDVGAGGLDEALARPGNAPAFGLVAQEDVGDRVPGRVALVLPAGPNLLLLRQGATWARVEIAAESDEVAAPPFEPQVVVQGRVAGSIGEGGGLLQLYRHEGGERIPGHGLATRLAPTGDFAVRVPAGTYDLEVSTERGTRRRASPMDATTPGGHIFLTLEAP